MDELDPVAARVDRELAAIARSVDVLGDVTPVNAEEAWQRSVAAGHRDPLALRYRPARTDPAAVDRALAQVALDDVADPGLRALFADSVEELRAQARLVAARETPEFLPRSLVLYGTADDALFALAEALLRRHPAPAGPDALVAPAAFAELARAEIDRYRRQDPTFAAEVHLRDDVPSLMVVQRDLLVGTDSWIPRHRAEALVHHEVGTHLLTAETGSRQPLVLFEQGLAGHEATQEALGVVAEHLVGGLDAERIRTLAARALGARRLSDGAGFPDLFAELHDAHGIPERAAWTITMRLVRGGGFTKDVIYLRGVVDLLGHLASGAPWEPLLVGKLHLRHVPTVDALLGAGVLVPPALWPHWLDGVDATAAVIAHPFAA